MSKWALRVIGSFALFHAALGLIVFGGVGGILGLWLFTTEGHILGFFIALFAFGLARRLNRKLQEDEQGKAYDGDAD